MNCRTQRLGAPRAFNGLAAGLRGAKIAARYGRINGAHPAPEPGCHRADEKRNPSE